MARGPHPARLNNLSGLVNPLIMAYFLKLHFPIELGNVLQCGAPSSLQDARAREIAIDNHI